METFPKVIKCRQKHPRKLERIGMGEKIAASSSFAMARVGVKTPAIAYRMVNIAA
jgi:hypothetical protein